MKYALIIDGIVEQLQPNKQDGFIEVADNIVCGMIQTDTDFIVPEIDLSSAKLNKKAEMRVKFNEVSVESVDVNGIIYNGGFDAALKLDGAKRLVELAGLTEVTFYGIDNKPKVLSIAEANTVILAISAKYQTDFAHLQELKVLIDSKQKVSTVETVNW